MDHCPIAPSTPLGMTVEAFYALQCRVANHSHSPMKPALSFDQLSSDNPNVTPEYMLAVMEGAIKHGLPVESTLLSLRGYGRPYHWVPCVELHWGWSTWLYRLSPSCRAAWEAAYLTKTAVRPFAVGDWVIATAPCFGELMYHPHHVVEATVKASGIPCWLTLEGRTGIYNADYFRHATPAEIAAHMAKTAPATKPFALNDWVALAPGTWWNAASVSTPPPLVSRIKVIGSANNGPTLYTVEGWPGAQPATSLRHATATEIAAHLGAQLATGHNPDHLTNWHVCPEMGWRLLDRDEIRARVHFPKRGLMQGWLNGRWDEVNPNWDGCAAWITYRTRLSRAELAALETPPATPKPLPPPYHDVPGLDPIGPGDYVIFKTDISLNGTSTLAHRKGDVHRVVKRTRSPFAMSDKSWKQGTIELEGLGIIHPAWVERVTSLKTVPLTMEDLPGGAFWVKDDISHGVATLVWRVEANGIWLASPLAGGSIHPVYGCFLTYVQLVTFGRVYSTDRNAPVTQWRPFSKVIPA